MQRKIKDKAVKSAENKEIKVGKREEDYFFPNIDGQQITVRAFSHEEALEKAKAKAKKNE